MGGATQGFSWRKSPGDKVVILKPERFIDLIYSHKMNLLVLLGLFTGQNDRFPRQPFIYFNKWKPLPFHIPKAWTPYGPFTRSAPRGMNVDWKNPAIISISLWLSLSCNCDVTFTDVSHKNGFRRFIPLLKVSFDFQIKNSVKPILVTSFDATS